MSKLIKIREISLKYDISARALKYYDGDIIGLYQGNQINKGFRRYSPIL